MVIHIKKTLAKAGIVALSAAPAIVFAQRTGPISNLSGLLDRIGGLVNLAVPVVIGITVLVILWGILGYITSGDDEEKRKDSKNYIIWGIVGLFVMVSLWGLVNILKGSFGAASEAASSGPGIPAVPTTNI